MKWKLWAPRYRKIVERLGLDENADMKASRILSALIPPPDLEELSGLFKNRECVVFGAGPSLDEDLANLSLGGGLDKTLIAADGATSAVLKHKTPDVVVTDLDGKVEDQVSAWRRGAWLVLHAHGDNISKLEEIAPRFSERVIGTTQVKPSGKLFNFGGFTDGDRAAFMAWELGASKIFLAGMDLGKAVGRYSGNKNPERKLAKLELCGELLGWLAELGANLANLTSRGEEIPNVLQMSA